MLPPANPRLHRAPRVEGPQSPADTSTSPGQVSERDTQAEVMGLTGGPGGPGGPFGPNRPRGPCKRKEQGPFTLGQESGPSPAPGKPRSPHPAPRAFAAMQVSTCPGKHGEHPVLACDASSCPHLSTWAPGSRGEAWNEPAAQTRDQGAPSEQGEPFKSREPFQAGSGQVHTNTLPAEATEILCGTERLCPRLS